MGGRRRIAQLAGPRDDGRAPPDDRTPPFELVDRQVDAVPDQGGERGLHTLTAHHPVEVPVLAACQREELAIRAGGRWKMTSCASLQEVVVPVLEAVPQGVPCLVERDGATQEPRKAARKRAPSSASRSRIIARGRLSRSRR